MNGRALLSVLAFASSAPGAPPSAVPVTPPSAAASSADVVESSLKEDTPPPLPMRPLRVALVSTSAFGVTHARFFNQLAGARVEYGFTQRFALGAALSYANLKGKEGRAHNALPEVELAYRLPLSVPSLTIPLRYGLGFLPKNGPTLRLGAGLALGLSSGLELELVPLETFVWVTRERPEVSLDGGVAVSAAW